MKNLLEINSEEVLIAEKVLRAIENKQDPTAHNLDDYYKKLELTKELREKILKRISNDRDD